MVYKMRYEKKNNGNSDYKDVGSDAAVDDDSEADRDSPHSPLSPPKQKQLGYICPCDHGDDCQNMTSEALLPANVHM